MGNEKIPEVKHDKRRSRGKETRKLILNSAVSSIAALGFSNATLDSVAEHAGVSRGLVVFHFKSKNLLITEVLDYLGSIYREGWDAVVNNTEGSTLDKIIRLIEYDIRFPCENREYLSAWAAFWGESKGNTLYRERAVPRDQRYADELKDLLEKFIIEEGYEIKELSSINIGLNAMQFGFWVESHLDPKPDDYKTCLAAAKLFLTKTFPKNPLSK